MKVIKRMDAARQGLNHYFTGKPCKYGHVDKRYVLNGLCVACNKEIAQQYRAHVKEVQRAAKKGGPK